MLTLHVLGSGTSVPSTRLPPAYLLRASDQAWLMDCGSGCMTSLARAGLTLDRLSGVVLTHLHPDHTADLVPLLFALANPVGPYRPGELPILGPVGTSAYFRGLGEVYDRWLRPRGGEVRISELQDQNRVTSGPLAFAAHAVEHSEGSLAYRVEATGTSLCLSGDSGPCAGLVLAARGAALFVCECSLLESETLEGHLNATQVGRIAAAAGVGRVVLTHLYDHVVASDPVSRVRALYSGPVELAEDGMVLTVGESM